jgi:hypothetical protein
MGLAAVVCVIYNPYRRDVTAEQSGSSVVAPLEG